MSRRKRLYASLSDNYNPELRKEQPTRILNDHEYMVACDLLDEMEAENTNSVNRYKKLHGKEGAEGARLDMAYISISSMVSCFLKQKIMEAQEWHNNN